MATATEDQNEDKKLDGISRQSSGPTKTPAELLERIPVMGQDDTRQVYGGDPGNTPTTPLGRKKRSGSKDGGSASDDESESSSNLFGSEGDDSSDGSGGGLYTGKGKKSGGLGLGFLKKKRVLALALTGGVVSLIFAFGGLLSQFKLNYLMDNLDQSTGIRMEASLDQRQLAYVRAYTQIRMMDAGGNFEKNGNHFFRVNKIKSGNPLYDWYKTLRTSNFEKDVFNNNGVFFGSFVTADGRIVPGYIKVDGTPIKPDNMGDIQKDIQNAVTNGDWAKLDNDFGKFYTKVDLANHKAGRQAIKEIVKANTQSYNVFKRRRVRKSMEQMAGVRSWRFFDQSRATASKTVKDVRNKLIDAATPKTATGRFLDCFFGVTGCQFSRDPDNPENLNVADKIPATGTSSESTQATDENGKPYTVDFSGSAKELQTIFDHAFTALNIENWLSMLDSLAQVSDAIKDGSITASVTVARGVQAMSLYQVFETAKDQSKTGQLTSDEMNQLMQAISNITASEAWIKVVEGKGDPTKLAAVSGTAAAVKYCNAGHKQSESEFSYICGNAQIGVSNASKFSDAYNNSTAGRIMGPVLKAYHQVTGGFFGFINKILNWVTKPFVTTAINAVKAVFPSAVKGVDDAVAWAAGKTAVFLGAGPLYDQNSVTSGQLGNWLVQGDAYTQESTMRDNGAALTNSDSQKTAEKNVLGFESDQTANQSLVARYLSPKNTRSITSAGLFAVSQIKFSSVGSFLGSIGTMFGTLASSFHLPFSHTALAASTSYGYAGAQLAQIPTYDFPTACYSLSPLAAATNATAGTNVASVFAKNGISSDNLPPVLADPNWEDTSTDINGNAVTVADAQTNSNVFYKVLYDALNKVYVDDSKTATKVAEQVYNCNLLDNAVRGDTGYAYGYTADHGYEENTGTSSQSGGSSGNLPSGSAQELASQILSNANISFTTSLGKQAIVDTSNGKDAQIEPRCKAGTSSPLSATLLGVLLKIADSHKIGIGYLTNGCHSNGSAHYSGLAADLNSVDGKPVSGSDPDRPFMHEITGILPSGSGLGQKECSSIPIDPINNVSLFDDSCDHIHLQVPQ